MARKKDVDLYEKNSVHNADFRIENPRQRVTAKGGKAIIDTTTGEVEDVAEIVSVHRVDNEQFVKIFTSNLKQFFNLKPTTYRMVQVLLHQLGRARATAIRFISTSAWRNSISSLPIRTRFQKHPITTPCANSSKKGSSQRAPTRTSIDKSRAVFQRRPRSVCEGIPQHRLATTATRPG